MRLIFILFIFFISITNGYAEVIFSDNFDHRADWQSPEQNFETGSDFSDQSGTTTTPCTSCPQESPVYSGLYSARSSWPDYKGNKTMNIDSVNRRGETGKGLTFWMEPVDSPNCDGGSGWCSDGQLAIWFPQSYQNIKLELQIKFDDNYGWDSTNAAASQKMFRFTNYNNDLGYSKWDYFYPMGHNALATMRFQDTSFYGTTGLATNLSPRYQSGYKTNVPSAWLNANNDYERQYVSDGLGGNRTFAELLGDGQWHKITFQLIANSALGAEDGTYLVAIDDVVVIYRDAVEWADAPWWDGCTTCINPPSDFIGWNYLTIGGNSYNRLDAMSVKREQWFAIDDIVVSTMTAPITSISATGTTSAIGATGTAVTISAD